MEPTTEQTTEQTTETPKPSVIADSPIYNVIRYDMKWYAKGHDPHDYNSMRDMSISEPIIVDKYEDQVLPDPMSEKLAKMVSDKLNEKAKEQEKVSIDLKNGQHYDGPRYVYSYYAGR